MRIKIILFATVEVRNPQIQNKQSNEAEQRWRPWTPRYTVNTLDKQILYFNETKII